jgi:predicted ATP-dependent serine protease
MSSALGVSTLAPNNQLIREVADVSSLLLRDALGRTGSVAYPSVPTERLARPVVVPVECSVSEPKEKGVPRTRASQGIGDKVLEDALDRLSDCGLEFSSRSVRVQCPTFGGEIVADSSAMLAVCLAIVTSHQRRTLPPVGAFGALAASGRVVPDAAAEHRIESLRRAGVGLVFGPPMAAGVVPRGVEYVPVQEIGDLVLAVLPYGTIVSAKNPIEPAAEKPVSMSSPAEKDDGSAP